LTRSVGSSGGLRGAKRSLYEGGIRVPFFVRWPGKTPVGEKKNSTVIDAVDLLPTFCKAAGIDLPEDFQADGEDMLAAFQGKKIMRSKPLFWE
jgi:arylsulfatase A-like enzyme